MVFSGLRQPIIDDSLPMPAYDLLPMKEYFESGAMGLAPRSVTNRKWMSVITSGYAETVAPYGRLYS